MQTRIKIVKRGELISRIPQSKGYIKLWHDYDTPHKWFIVGLCLIPIIGQLLLLVLIHNFIISLWWTDLSNYEFSKPAEKLIDDLYQDTEDVKTKRLKKKVDYIKYP